jgi:hypothetical protein
VICVYTHGEDHDEPGALPPRGESKPSDHPWHHDVQSYVDEWPLRLPPPLFGLEERHLTKFIHMWYLQVPGRA